jgi:hypothetical protein
MSKLIARLSKIFQIYICNRSLFRFRAGFHPLSWLNYSTVFVHPSGPARRTIRVDSEYNKQLIINYLDTHLLLSNPFNILGSAGIKSTADSRGGPLLPIAATRSERDR